MKRRFVAALSFLATLIVVGMGGAAQSALYNRGGGLVYDDVLDITWLQDANFAATSGYHVDGQMYWAEANSWVEGLVYYDAIRNLSYNDWRLPSADVNGDTFVLACQNSGGCGTDNEMGYLFWTLGITSDTQGPFINIQPGSYWTGTDAVYDGDRAWLFRMYNGVQGTNIKTTSPLRAWAVREGDVAPPSPSPQPYHSCCQPSASSVSWVGAGSGR